MRIFLLIFFFLITFKGKSQEGIPIYFDYLTENYYLVHPSMAGVNLVGGKIQFKARSSCKLNNKILYSNTFAAFARAFVSVNKWYSSLPSG